MWTPPLSLLSLWKPMSYPLLYEKSLFQLTHVLCVVIYFTKKFVPFVHTFPQVKDFHFLWLRSIQWCIIKHFLYPVITSGQLVWVHIVNTGDGILNVVGVGIFSHCIDFISHKYMPITVISISYGCSCIFSLMIALIIFIVALLICISVNST